MLNERNSHHNRPIILKPLVSEKSMGLIKENFYTFLVDRDADKRAISKAIADKFDVNVLQVKTVNIRGKLKQQRTRKGHFRTSSFKKAVIQLKKGQKISLFESSTEEVEVRTVEGEVITKTKEKKNLLRTTKVKIEKNDNGSRETDSKKKSKKVKSKKAGKK